MHLGDNSELRVVACIHDQENIPTMISLLEAINPSKRSPIATYALHLIELVGQSTPLLIPDKFSKRPSSKASSSKRIVNAFRIFEQSYYGVVTVHPFTSISTYATMHDEICTMALDKKASLIILPFHKRYTTTEVWEAYNKGVKIVNDNILVMAPCSIAIIVDCGLLHNSRPTIATWSSYRVAILFLGGADDREALAIGSRMAGRTNINVTMVRLLENGSITGNNSTERKLDNEVVSGYRLSMAGNFRVKYVEEVAKDATGTVAVLKSMQNNYELIIVGRRHDKQSPLVFGLTGWDEESELGEVGYILASSDFHGNASILVVQQHAIVWDAKDFTVDMSQEIEDEAEHLPIYRAAAALKHHWNLPQAATICHYNHRTTFDSVQLGNSDQICLRSQWLSITIESQFRVGHLSCIA